jgi:LysR family cyn operon transcriptional activator
MPSILDHGIELRHLRYFVAIVEAGSFTRAAALIGLRQPTLSHQIRQLEKMLGSSVFHRTRRFCRLTAAGEMLLPAARRILSNMDDVRRSLDDLSGLSRGSLSVAVLPVLSASVLPPALSQFHTEHPGIRARISEMSVDDMERALVLGTVELGIGFMPPSETSLRGQALYSEELVAVVTKNDPLAPSHKTSIALEELAGRPLMIPPPGFGTRILIMNAFAKIRRTPIIAMELSSMDALLQTVLSCKGLGIVPASALWGRPHDGLSTMKIVRPTPRRSIGFISMHGVSRSPAVEAFCDAVRHAVKLTAMAE